MLRDGTIEVEDTGTHHGDHASTWSQTANRTTGRTIGCKATRTREDRAQVHASLRGIAARRAELDAREAQYLAEAEQLRLWEHFGYATMREYMERELGYGPREATERLRLARRLAELPTLAERLADGTFAVSAVRELARVTVPDTEDAWIAEASDKTLREIEQLVSGRKPGDRPEDPADPDLRTRRVTLELSPHAYALLRQARSELETEHGGSLGDDELIEALCRRALAPAPAAPSGGGGSRPPFQIHVTTCEDCGRGWQNGAGRAIEVDAATIERARCDAELLGRLDADPPARATRTVSPRRRAQVLARDGYRCVVPGCRSAKHLDVHHLEFQSRGGGNAMWNLATTCGAHHKALHEGRLSITGRAPDQLEVRWTHVAGRRRRSAASSASATAPIASRGVRAPSLDPQLVADARAALVGLGFKPSEARAAVDAAMTHVGPEPGLETLIRGALQACPAPRSG